MFARNVVTLSAACALLVTCTSCSRTEYQIEMSFDEAGLHRRLTVWEERTENNQTTIHTPQPAELDTLRSAYGSEGREDATGRMVFEGTFADVGPSDIGGTIAVARWTTSLGTLSAYNERVRGSDDLANRWEERARKIDRWCELMSGWVEQNSVDPEQGSELSDFINGPLKEDLQNLSMHFWILATVEPLQSDEEFGSEVIMRLTQFGIEHNYITVEDVPTLYRLGMSSEAHEALEIVLGLLDRKRGAGVTPLVDAVPVLRSIDLLNASLADYFRNTPEAEALRQRSPDRDLAEQDLLNIPVELLAEALIVGSFFGGPNHVSLRFAVEQEPLVTNGRWDPATSGVTWNNTVESRGESPQQVLPMLCYATWAVPNEEYQQLHFGRVIFTGEPLAGYVLWYEGLDDAQAAEWDRFLEELTPADDLRRKFDRFRFEGEPASTEEAALRSDIPRQLLETALAPRD